MILGFIALWILALTMVGVLCLAARRGDLEQCVEEAGERARAPCARRTTPPGPRSRAAPGAGAPSAAAVRDERRPRGRGLRRPRLRPAPGPAQRDA